ncbi:MAG: ParB domain protein nuclease [Xanthobacteraceae bacterium]|jgi:ParB family chromosome partitioning protein|nr:ParB domain protein nuclease [Xanthobacteraceae bacterium]
MEKLATCIPHHVGAEQNLTSIAIGRIRIANPRARNARVFAGIVESIATVGLKRPITVAECRADGSDYDLVCGQGRLEAFQALGESAIPAVVIKASEVDRFLMSLIENLARRKHSNRDLLEAVRVLEDQGYGPTEIGRKTGLDPSYISDVLQLLKGGEARLIGAVEKGWLPIRLATQIAKLSDDEVQLAMMEAYQNGLLRGEELLKVRHLIDRRRASGAGYAGLRRKGTQRVTPSKLAQMFKSEVHRQQLVIKKCEMAEERLLFVVTALRRMLADENFVTLLRAENIEDMPTPLAQRVVRKALP